MAPLSAIAVLLAAPLLARSDPTDEFIRAEMKRQNIPGLSIAVLENGELVKAEGYGVANLETGTPATPRTVYRIASVSKQFIAAGILLLIQDDRLGLDDPIDRYLDGAPETWSDITIRHLLTHTSGLMRDGPGFDPRRVQSDADVIRSAYQRPLRFGPGEAWEYSNLGYFALAEIIRVVSGRPWSEFLRERIFEPLDMRSTFPTNTTEPMAERATGYTDNDRLIPGEDWPALRPSGAFFSTVLDLAKWDAALHTDRVLNESTRREMWEPVALADGGAHPYGLGWQIGEVEDQRVVYHGGGMVGFRAGFARAVDERISVIVLMNLSDVDLHAILFGVLRLHLPGGSPGSELGPSSAAPMGPDGRGSPGPTPALSRLSRP